MSAKSRWDKWRGKLLVAEWALTILLTVANKPIEGVLQQYRALHFGLLFTTACLAAFGTLGALAYIADNDRVYRKLGYLNFVLFCAPVCFSMLYWGEWTVRFTHKSTLFCNNEAFIEAGLSRLEHIAQNSDMPNTQRKSLEAAYRVSGVRLCFTDNEGAFHRFEPSREQQLDWEETNQKLKNARSRIREVEDRLRASLLSFRTYFSVYFMVLFVGLAVYAFRKTE